MCACMCVCVHLCFCACVFAMCMHTCIRKRVHKCVRKCVSVWVGACGHVCVRYVSVCVFVCQNTSMIPFHRNTKPNLEVAVLEQMRFHIFVVPGTCFTKYTIDCTTCRTTFGNYATRCKNRVKAMLGKVLWTMKFTPTSPKESKKPEMLTN